ncbi:non-specific lipid-transfer protein 1-like [Euphorbia lathyris]|uniref:non-specific lipid-transfer protein 1-like n=1 Tax=Euphorbia lathyris TaxID=212925 RepID=UPI00331333E5
MAAMKLAVLVVAIMVVAGAMSTAEGITCGQVSGALAPCINYLKTGGAPTPQCCSGVRTINGAAQTTPDRQQACNCLKSAARSIPGLNPANAESLPGKCSVNIPYKISFDTNCNSIK